MNKLTCPKVAALADALASAQATTEAARIRLDAAQSPVRIAATCGIYADSGILITTSLDDILRITGKAAGDVFAAERGLRAAHARLQNLINAR